MPGCGIHRISPLIFLKYPVLADKTVGKQYDIHFESRLQLSGAHKPDADLVDHIAAWRGGSKKWIKT